jgi:putative membrane protein
MMMKRIAAGLGVVGLFVLVSTPASAAPSQQDTTYLVAAHQSNLAEIAAGQLAQQKGQSQQVKDLGAKFVTDHTQLDSALTQAAGSLGVTLPNTPNSQQQALAARYQAAQGTGFDSLFIATQMDAHMQAAANGQREIQNGSDATAKKTAQDAAPVIAAHHDLLRSAASALGLPSNVDTGTGGLAATNGHQWLIPALAVLGLAVLVAGVLLLRRPRVTS